MGVKLKELTLALKHEVSWHIQTLRDARIIVPSSAYCAVGRQREYMRAFPWSLLATGSALEWERWLDVHFP